MNYLVDANVLSEATKLQPNPKVIAWLAEHETELAINSIILGELHYGVLLLPESKRRTQLLEWLEAGTRYLTLLDIDAATAGYWAQLLSLLKRKGWSMPVKDSLIAASALQYQLPVVTRNEKDFIHSGIRVINPFV